MLAQEVPVNSASYLVKSVYEAIVITGPTRREPVADQFLPYVALAVVAVFELRHVVYAIY